jgi:hypothetical protein
MYFDPSFYPVTRLLSENPGTLIPKSFALVQSESGHRVEGRARRWSRNFFSLRIKSDFQVLGEANSNDRGLTVLLDNRTSYTIKDSLIYYQNRFLDMGEIAPMTKKIVEMKKEVIDQQKQAGSPENDWPKWDGERSERPSLLGIMQNHLKKDLLWAIHSKYRDNHEALKLIGWIPSGIIHPEFREATISGEGLTLVFCDIPLKAG